MRTISPRQIERFGPGRVLASRERNGYDDSDFEALVATKQDDGTYTFKWVLTDTTRASFGDTAFFAVPDASDEVKAAYNAHRDAENARLAARDAEIDARRITKGKTVTVVKGRKIPKGTTAIVMWKGEDKYRPTYGRDIPKAYRVGLKIDGIDSLVYTAEENVRVVGHETEDVPFDRDGRLEYAIAMTLPAIH